MRVMRLQICNINVIVRNLIKDMWSMLFTLTYKSLHKLIIKYTKYLHCILYVIAKENHKHKELLLVGKARVKKKSPL